MIRVLVVDDERLVCAHLRTILGAAPDIEVVAEAYDGAEAVEAVLRYRPDLVLMDLRMPGLDGMEATRRLRAEHQAVKVIVLTTYADDQSVVGALQAGADGYLTKDAGGDEIRQALERVLDGQAVIDPAVQRLLVDAVVAGAPQAPREQAAETALPDGLTPREAEVLGLIAAGLSNAEIAARLVVSEATVKSHINHLLPKIGARDRAQAVTYAYQRGLA